MSRPSSPWFRKSRNAWYVWHNGKLTDLHVKGEKNEAEAVRAWHRLFAGMPQESSQKLLQSHQSSPAAPTGSVSDDKVSVAHASGSFVFA